LLLWLLPRLLPGHLARLLTVRTRICDLRRRLRVGHRCQGHLGLALDENLALSLSLITMHGFFLGWLYVNTRSLLIAVLGHASLSVANNSLSLPDQGVVQIALTLLLCVVILAFFRVTDLRPRLDFTRRKQGVRLEGPAS